MPEKDDLLALLFEERSNILFAPMAAWLASSRRFAHFVTAHHAKIRKKLRTAQDPESQQDLQLELEMAYLLLRERSFSVAYEPQPRHIGRGPDYSVRFNTSLEFMLEVTRIRTVQQEIPSSIHDRLSGKQPQADLHTVPRMGDRFSDMLCSKLGQLLPQRINLLLVGVEAANLSDFDLNAAILQIQQRVEANDMKLLQKHGFRDRADFFKQYQRLSSVLLRSIPIQKGQAVEVWLNPQAKFPLPTRIRTALTRSQTL